MINDDVVLNKAETIERCLKRIHEEYDNNPTHLQNYTKQDSIILNIQRASEASIDLAMHTIAKKRLGVPQTSREAFDLLHHADIIDVDLTVRMKAMVGFRNITVHDYQTINLIVVQQIIEKHLDDLRAFTKIILQQTPGET